MGVFGCCVLPSGTQVYVCQIQRYHIELFGVCCGFELPVAALSDDEFGGFVWLELDAPVGVGAFAAIHFLLMVAVNVSAPSLSWFSWSSLAASAH